MYSITSFQKDALSWIDPIEIDDLAMEQLQNISQLPFVFKHIAIMPDVHAGYGMPIGGVVVFNGYISPNCVGVDIACGMVSVETDMYADVIQDMVIRRKIIDTIKKYIPTGMNHHKEEQGWERYNVWLYTEKTLFTDSIINSQTLNTKNSLFKRSLGTLGGGNHYWELEVDQNNKIWITIHSGSRNLGLQIAKYYHQEALKMNKLWKSQLPHDDLAYLPVDSQLGNDYINDMNFAMEYAFENRRRMMSTSLEHLNKILGLNPVKEINIHHNYASLENHFGRNIWVHRKGATSAKLGEYGIIPGSMGTPTYIVKGKGNIHSFKSCSHGAGRVMSRTRATEELNVDLCNADMEGIVFDRWGKSRRGKTKGMYDLGEAPRAYKDIHKVIADQADLVEVVNILQPLAVIKGE